MKLHSQVNRAQLLRAWHGVDAVSRAETADILGYEPSARYLKGLLEEAETVKPEEKHKPDSGSPSIRPTTLKPPKPRPQVTYYALVQRERYATEQQAGQDKPQIFEGVEAISDEALAQWWRDFSKEPLCVTPLTQPRTMAPFIRQVLRQEVGQRLSIRKLVRQVAERQPLKTLPTEPRLLPAGRVTVIADVNDRLLPFWDDIREACELIRQKHGKIGLDMRVLARQEPRDDYYEFDDWVKRKLKTKNWQKIPPQSMVFIFSDLGQLASANNLIRKRWLSFVCALNRRGITPVVLAPVAAAKQCPLVQARTQLVLWQRYGGLHTQKTRGDKVQHQRQVERVLTFLSLSPHIEPKLLRAFCEFLSQQEGCVGIEADVYLHPDVQWGYTAISIRSERREHYQQLFSLETQAFKQQILDLIGRHHAPQFAGVWAESILNAEPLMEVDAQWVNRAERLMLGFAKRYANTPAHDGMERFARRHLSRLSEAQHKSKDYIPALFTLANRTALRQGEAIPEIYQDKTAIINQLLREVSERQHYYLYQLGPQLVITQKKPQRGQCLAEFDTLQDFVWVDGVSRPLTPRPPLPQLFCKNDVEGGGENVSVAFSSSPQSTVSEETSVGRRVGVRGLTIDTGQERITIAALKKPSWASELTMRDGILAATLPFAGKTYQLQPVWQNEKLQWQPTESTQEVGYDDCGLYADLAIKGITQRLRYIEPNTFIMGSPQGESGRYDDEDLHQVTLTQGYWLADTACTQALWQAVMSDNPAEFKDDPQNPVENVSWLDVQQFIAKLNELYPALGAHLPTEAQWENACRAGTDTPFNFVGEISLEKVNYSGIWDEIGYADKAKQKTVPVKNYSPNTWGLYEMHGNVLEWCFDEWQENLGNDPVVDPVTARFKSGVKPEQSGQQTVTAKSAHAYGNSTNYDSKLLEDGRESGVLRVLRGGSWLNYGGYCRSAIRSRFEASYRAGLVGFRFAVGHELQNSTVLRSNKAVKTTQSSEQTDPKTVLRDEAQVLDQAGSGDVETSLIERWVKGAKGLLSRKKDEQ